jgi:hypothetical protein
MASNVWFRNKGSETRYDAAWEPPGGGYRVQGMPCLARNARQPCEIAN